ncbi:MAG: DUF2799 domain-containing protein [Gammaproteobacteria bacterium]
MMLLSKNLLNLLLTLFIASVITSCATLNKDECRTANWKLIGYEDGSNGYPTSRIGEHRKACAEYGISPDLDLYNEGRAEGLHQYCVPATAYNLGRQGSSYQGNCAGYDEARFLSAFNQGIKLFTANAALSQLQKILSQRQEDLSYVKEEIHNKEQLIVDGKQSKTQIILLLLETKELYSKKTTISVEINNLQDDIEEQNSYISHIQNQNRY